jgi:flagellar hook-basal body complex protein FliE
VAILPINLSVPPVASALAVVPTPSSGEAFGSAFAEAVSKVESFQANAQTSVDRFLSGEGEELHQVALKAQQADIAFELFTQVRNKVVAAYQEVMRMQV